MFQDRPPESPEPDETAVYPVDDIPETLPDDILPAADDDSILADPEPDNPDNGTNPSRYRSTAGDPAFGFLLALAVSIGLIPLLPDQADLRYTLAWGVLALVGVLTWLLGNNSRIGQEQPENIIWGLGLGLLVSVPFILFFGETFGRASTLLFPGMSVGTLLAYLIFVMPLAESLFFRGLLQQYLDFPLAGLSGGVWSIILFFPVMWGHILEAPAVAIFLAIALLAMNMMYSYVRERNGLAAAWLCQIIAGLVLLFLPVF